jgi:hypothetical protein
MRASLLASATIATLRWVRRELRQPCAQAGCLFRPALHHRSGSLHEQHAQVLITPPRNPPQYVLAASGVFLRNYPQPYSKVTSPAKCSGVADGGDDGGQDHRAYSRHRDQPLAGFVLLGNQSGLYVAHDTLALRDSLAVRSLMPSLLNSPRLCGAR